MKFYCTSAFILAATAAPLISIVNGEEGGIDSFDTKQQQYLRRRNLADAQVCSDENNKEWHLKHMKVPEAWAYSEANGKTSGGEGIVIAQIDTGYSDHDLFNGMFPDGDGAVKGINVRWYADRPLATNEFLENAPELYDPRDPLTYKLTSQAFGEGHGTVVASAAMNRGTTVMNEDENGNSLSGLAPRGTAPKANLYSIRVADNPVLGPLDSARVRTAFDLINNDRGHSNELIGEDNVHVISISLGSGDEMNNNFQNLGDKMHKAMNEKNVIIVSAGGQVFDFVMSDAVWPARYERVIGVGGYQMADTTDADPGENYEDRNMTWWGSAIDGPSIDITGPALNVCNGNVNRKWTGGIEYYYSNNGSGTSLATAFLGGIAALWLGHHGRDNLINTFDVPHGIKLQEAFQKVLELTANQEGWDGEYDTSKHGYGMVDAEAILKQDLQEVIDAIIPPPPTPTPTPPAPATPTPPPATPTPPAPATPTPPPATPTPPPATAPTPVGGDPHFNTFNGKSFSFHGECDLVLMKNEGFESGQGPTIHIRTTRVDKVAAKYSYISAAAIAMGPDILEVFDDGSLIINGEDVSSKMNDGANMPSTTTFNGEVVTKTFRGSKQAIVIYDIPLSGTRSPFNSSMSDDTAQSVQIRINTIIGMIFLEVNGSYPDNVGMMGNPKLKDALMARDGFTNLLGTSWNSFAEEWQVRDDEPQLFQDKNRAPQYPAGCRYEQSNHHPHHLGGDSKSNSRRRLLSDVEVTVEDANEACAGSLDGSKKKYCVSDVMATGYLELAKDPFYH